MPANTNRVERQWVKILTVDPASRRVEGILKDFAPIQISVNEIPLAFRWPKEGEWWLIVRENYDWFLRAPRQNSDDTVKVEDLDPGDTLLGAEGASVYIQGSLFLDDLTVDDLDVEGNLNVDGQIVTQSDMIAMGEVVGGPASFDSLTLSNDMSINHITGDPALSDDTIPVWDSSTGWRPATNAEIEATIAVPYSEVITGNGTQTLWTINHNLGTRQVFVSIRQSSAPFELVQAQVRAASISTITVEAIPAPAVGVSYVVTVARALGGASAPPSSPIAHSASHASGGSDPLPAQGVAQSMLAVAPQVSVNRSTNVSVAHNVDITWNQEIYDTDGMWTSGTGARITIQTTGYYIVTAQLYLQGAAVEADARICMNAGAIVIASGPTTPVSTHAEVQCVFIGRFVAGDYVTARHWNSGGGALTVHANDTCWFRAYRLGNW